MRLFLGFLVLSVVLAGCTSGPGEYDSFAKCLTEKGVKMYGTEWCPHCQNQKRLFGSSFDNINYIDCDIRREECVNAGIQGYPTWIIKGQQYPGEKSLEELSDLTGCELAKDRKG